MIHEDLLLSRIDILENKLSCYQKNITNEKLQEQIDRLQDEKEVYQVSIMSQFMLSFHLANFGYLFCILFAENRKRSLKESVSGTIGCNAKIYKV